MSTLCIVELEFLAPKILSCRFIDTVLEYISGLCMASYKTRTFDLKTADYLLELLLVFLLSSSIVLSRTGMCYRVPFDYG